jgi:hypothetical protein
VPFPSFTVSMRSCFGGEEGGREIEAKLHGIVDPVKTISTADSIYADMLSPGIDATPKEVCIWNGGHSVMAYLSKGSAALTRTTSYQGEGQKRKCRCLIN